MAARLGEPVLGKASRGYRLEKCATSRCGIWPGFAPGSVGATQQAWLVASAGREPLPDALVLLQSQDGNAKLPGYFPPAVKLSGFASHSDGG
jgi:hypothetical protein